jgi:hypothetical protein
MAMFSTEYISKYYVYTPFWNLGHQQEVKLFYNLDVMGVFPQTNWKEQHTHLKISMELKGIKLTNFFINIQQHLHVQTISQ